MWRSSRGGRQWVAGPRIAAAIGAATVALASPATGAPSAPGVSPEAGAATAAAALPAAGAPPVPRLTPEASRAIMRSAAADRVRSDLKPRSDGSYDYLDPQRRFRARITADGRVSFQSTAPIRDLGVCTDRQLCVTARGVAAILRDHSRWQRASTANDYGSALHGAAASPATRHLTIASSPGEEMPSPVLLGIGGRFGPSLVSDRIKAEFLRDTFDFRLGLAQEAERRRLVASLSELEETLEMIWQEERTPLAHRRSLLFELWDRCIDTPAQDSDSGVADDLDARLEELRHRAAAEVKRKVLRFIRERAPAGSDAAYTLEELRRLNARRCSRDAFAPYDAP